LHLYLLASVFVSIGFFSDASCIPNNDVLPQLTSLMMQQHTNDSSIALWTWTAGDRHNLWYMQWPDLTYITFVDGLHRTLSSLLLEQTPLYLTISIFRIHLRGQLLQVVDLHWHTMEQPKLDFPASPEHYALILFITQNKGAPRRLTLSTALPVIILPYSINVYFTFNV